MLISIKAVAINDKTQLKKERLNKELFFVLFSPKRSKKALNALVIYWSFRFLNSFRI